MTRVGPAGSATGDRDAGADLGGLFHESPRTRAGLRVRRSIARPWRRAGVAAAAVVAAAVAGPLLAAPAAVPAATALSDVHAHGVVRDPQIVFDRGAYASRIRVSNRSGSWVKPLTGARAEFRRPRWHPSGRRILCAKVALNGRADADLMLMSPRGHHKRVLLPGDGRNFIEAMAWAPDGRHLALVMDRGRISDLWVYTLSTGELRRLDVYRHPDRIPWDLDWSPTGTIAFSAYDFTSPSEDSDVYLVQPDGSDLRQVTDTAERSESGPRFSPDGQRLLYMTQGRCGGYVVLARADGGAPERARGVGCHLRSSSWSPNARRLLVVRFANRDIWPGIWDMTLDGTRKRFVALGEDASWRPRVAPVPGGHAARR